jgi:hypothetical protein
VSEHKECVKKILQMEWRAEISVMCPLINYTEQHKC